MSPRTGTATVPPSRPRAEATPSTIDRNASAKTVLPCGRPKTTRSADPKLLITGIDLRINPQTLWP